MWCGSHGPACIVFLCCPEGVIIIINNIIIKSMVYVYTCDWCQITNTAERGTQ